MKDDSFRDFVLDQLRSLPGVQCRSMFGGHGLRHDGVFFGLLFGGRLYLKTDTATRPEFLARGSAPFRPNTKQTLNSYYEVPPEILEDHEELARWARRAASAQTASAPKPRRKNAGAARREGSAQSRPATRRASAKRGSATRRSR